MEAASSPRRSALGDAAFDRLVRAHRAPLERYARGLGASREDAEEIAATALLRAYQHPPGVRFDQEWRAWLSTVARNLWIDARRRRQLRLVTADGVLEAVPSTTRPVDQIAATAEEARQICAAIALLPPAQRAAMYLREVRGLSYEEIAAELGITQRALTSTLQRARETVKQRRGGVLQALAALSFSPLRSLRRAANAGHAASASGVAAKIALPVVLMAGAGGAALVAEHASNVAPHRATAKASRLTSTASAVSPAERAARKGVVSPAARRAASPSDALQRHGMSSAQRSTAGLSAPAAPAETTMNAGVPEAVPSSPSQSTITTTGTGTGNAAPPGSQTKTRPPRRAHKGAPPTRPQAADNHAATRSSKAAATSSRPPSPAHAKRAPATGTAAAAPSATAAAHRGTAAPAGPPASTGPGISGRSGAHPAAGTGAAGPDTGAPAAANTGAPVADPGSQGAAGGSPEATATAQTAATHAPAGHGGNGPQGPSQ